MQHVKCTAESLPVKWVANYIFAYQRSLIDAGLTDDSADITIADLINYVNTQLDKSDWIWYGLKTKIELI